MRTSPPPINLCAQWRPPTHQTSTHKHTQASSKGHLTTKFMGQMDTTNNQKREKKLNKGSSP